MKTRFSLDACCKIGGFSGSRNSMENGGQKTSKIIQKWSLGRSGAGFFKFLEDFEAKLFEILVPCTCVPKLKNVRNDYNISKHL